MIPPGTPRNLRGLKRLKVKELKKICSQLDLSTRGTKNELTLRILDAVGEDGEITIQVEENDDTKGNDDTKENDDKEGDIQNSPPLNSPRTSSTTNAPTTPDQSLLVMMQFVERMQNQQFELEQRRLEEQEKREQQRLEEQDRREQQRLQQQKEFMLEVLSKTQTKGDITENTAALQQLEYYFDTAERKLAALQDASNESKPMAVFESLLKSIVHLEEDIIEFIAENSTILPKLTLEIANERLRKLSDKLLKEQVALGELQGKGSGYLPSSITPPEFSGDTLQFPIWWENFDAVVHSNPKVSKFYKYLYLRQCLKGQAAHCLDGFSPLTDHYENALQHVKDEFGRPRKIVRNTIKMILDMPTMNADSKSLKKSYDKPSWIN